MAAYSVYYEGASAKLTRNRGQSVSLVAEAVVHALTARRPKRRYVVGADAKAVVRLSVLPGRVRDWLLITLMRKQTQRALPASAS